MSLPGAVDGERLGRRLEELGAVGRVVRGGVEGVCRLALSEEDRRGRDLVISWMREDGLEVRVDAVGNIFALEPGREGEIPVMAGSHIDSVDGAGKYDGCYGVLAALEALRAIRHEGGARRRPLAVGVFTNEEGVRYTPDMLGSLVHAGGMTPEEARNLRGFDGTVVGEELDRMGYSGDFPCGSLIPAAYVELHVEQGPVLFREGTPLGVVEVVTGISWQEFEISGTANHAGTTPMEGRRDAAVAAARVILFVRDLAREMGGAARATVGMLRLEPGGVNVVPDRALFTVDLRHSDARALEEIEEKVAAFGEDVARQERVAVERRSLARFDPVPFDPGVMEAIRRAVADLGMASRPMISGAGHDAQMMARICPAAMIFVPSRDGISHNPREYTPPEDLERGARVLRRTLEILAERD
ncbi:MAG TPA: M20 family metallo-hydrolase [Synergistaceae bacterium]|jgi:N-carbamoyl-L-amino-acid hydrolase|nr:M20 family metallo-hydrolase [Synergistaceae bacterium]HQF90967.1 M20 family metallo-hydrolase [Synergistaceae bacterium]HQH77939.1 M20 family metallo-hydrolase [Synergistaceae bacterium]